MLSRPFPAAHAFGSKPIPTAMDVKRNVTRAEPRMSQRIVQGFFQYKKKLTADCRTHRGLALLARCVKGDCAIRRCGQLPYISPHTAAKFIETIVHRIDGPDHVADRIDDFARNRADL